MKIVIKGAGDLATGIASRLYHAGHQISCELIDHQKREVKEAPCEDFEYFHYGHYQYGRNGNIKSELSYSFHSLIQHLRSTSFS